MMIQNAECRRIRELMDSYISGELAVESNHDVLAHLERCESCRGETARRGRMRALLTDSFGGAPDAAAITARVTGALDREQHRWSRLARYGSIAAALVLIAGSAVWFTRPVDAAAFDDSVDNHIACALTTPPDAVYDAARIQQYLNTEYQSIVNAVSHKEGSYDLIDAHMCPYQGRDYVHLVYRDTGGHLVSVFAEPSVRGRLPLTHQAPRKGFVTTATTTGGHQVFVVSESGTPAPPDVVRDMLDSTASFVKRLEK
jgi:anti-sigma factor RsiW